MVTLTDLAAIGGLIFGLTGMILGFLNFFRDRPSVQVYLKWDMKSIGNPQYSVDKLWGVVSVTNIGRRPIFISHVHLKVPKGYDSTHLLLSEGIKGDRISEGDKPVNYMIDQEGLAEFKKDWKSLVAVVIDSTGKEHKSPKIKTKPSWAK